MEIDNISSILKYLTETEKLFFEENLNKMMSISFPQTFLDYLGNQEMYSYNLADFYNTSNVTIVRNPYPNHVELFYMEDTIAVVKHSNIRMPFQHMHDYFEFIYVYDGDAKNYINGRYFKLSKGDLFILPPHKVHSISASIDSIILNIKVNKSFFRSYFFNLPSPDNPFIKFFIHALYKNNTNNFLLFNTGESETIKNTILMIQKEFLNHQKYSDKILTTLFSLLFSYLLTDYGEAAQTSSSFPKGYTHFTNMVQYIENNYRTVTLDELADNMHFSKPYTCSIIKRCSDASFSEILQQTRIYKARQLLETTDFSIEKISDEVGFSDIINFTVAFKKYCSITPLQYKKGAQLL